MDKFKATWLSHSSISDFLKCPRSYYLRNVYKDPRSGHKIAIVTPALALGQVVHEVLESLSELPVEARFEISLVKKFDVAWQKITGKLGGFKDHDQEQEYKERGIQMLINVQEDPKILLNKAIKIKSAMGLPNYWLSEKDEIILCGKIDWLEYLETTDSVHIVDFKTGKNTEKEDSLQLPIYLLLAKNTQKREVTKASYWYLDHDDSLIEKKLPDEKEAYDKIYKIGKEIKLARAINHFKCPHNGCINCTPYEKILRGEGEKVGVSGTRQDIYVV